MRIDVKIDGIDEALAALNPKEYKKALSKTVRRMGQRLKTTATKEVRKTYSIKANKLKDKIKTRTMTDGNDVAWRFKISGNQSSLINFGARKTKKGVSVKVRKDRGRRVIRGAFIATGKNGNVHVFQRIGKDRLPIESKKTLSIPQMFNKEILDKAKREVEANYEKEFKHNFDFYLGRG
ncbi:phage tail protein [Hydrogenimonas sp.]